MVVIPAHEIGHYKKKAHYEAIATFDDLLSGFNQIGPWARQFQQQTLQSIIIQKGAISIMSKSHPVKLLKMTTVNTITFIIFIIKILVNQYIS